MKKQKVLRAIIICLIIIGNILPVLVFGGVGISYVCLSAIFGKDVLIPIDGIVVDYDTTYVYGDSGKELRYYEIYECELDGEIRLINGGSYKSESLLRPIGEEVELYYNSLEDEVLDINILEIFQTIGIVLLIIAAVLFIGAIILDIILLVCYILLKKKQKVQ